MSRFDENADVLRGFEDRGIDLSSPRVVDFSHIFLDPASATKFIEACKTAGFEAEDTTDEEMDCYDVTVSREMTPTSENITVIEQALGNIAEQFNGRSDGWGFFGN